MEDPEKFNTVDNISSQKDDLSEVSGSLTSEDTSTIDTSESTEIFDDAQTASKEPLSDTSATDDSTEDAADDIEAEFTSDDLEALAEAQNDPDSEKRIFRLPTAKNIVKFTPQPPMKASTGKKVAAFIMLLISLLFCAAFFATSGNCLAILIEGKSSETFGDAIGAFFAVLFSAPVMIMSAIPTFLSTLITMLLFRGIKKKELHSTFYKVMSVVTLVLFILVVVMGALDIALIMIN